MPDDTLTDEVVTSIEDVPVDDYDGTADGDDSELQDGPVIPSFELRQLSLAAKPIASYLPLQRTIKLGMVGRDCYAVKRALSVAGFGNWGGWGSRPHLFGRFAKKNLAAFQKKYNIQISGVYGEATHKKLAPFFDDYGRFLMGQPLVLKNPYQVVVNTAMYGYTKRYSIHYTQGGLRMEGVRNKLEPPAFPHWEDCSSFATWCYFVAGLKDPNGRNYDGFGYTGTLINHGRRVSIAAAKPGDLVFYGNSGINHVAILVDNNKVVSHGSEGGPYFIPVWYRSDVQYAISYWR